MMYEFHATIAPVESSEWIRACQEFSFKPLFIRLSKGDFPDQMMCSTRIAADWNMATDYAGWLEDFLTEWFVVKRVKVELALSDADMWAEHNQLEPLYYETHLRQPLDNKASQVITALRNEDFGMSHNVFAGNMWFTYRLPGNISGSEAKNRYNKIFGHVNKVYSVDMSDFHHEAVVKDTNPELDKGWVEVPKVQVTA